MSTPTLTVLTEGLSYQITVLGATMYVDSARTQPVTFPLTITNDTTWYAAPLSGPGRRAIAVNGVATVGGATFGISGISGLPATVEAAEGVLYYGDAVTKAAADAAYPALGDITYIPTTIPTRQGAIGNYTGRQGTAGTGTDSRAAIQAALTAASNRNDATYYGYLSTNSVTVKLPAGVYYISNPNDGTPSLSIPARVTFDCSDATMFFDPPSSAMNTWCGIQVNQYANLIVGRLMNTPGVAWPDTQDTYDAVRIWQTDGESRVVGGKDSEINGFQGACVRGVGCWITYLKDIRFTGSSYGYIASNYYPSGSSGILGGSLIAPSGYTFRDHTDLRIDNCVFINLSKGGLLGVVQGKSGNLNANDYTNSGLTVGLKGCVFENIGAYAFSITNASVVTLLDCAFEECGTIGSGMNYADTIYALKITGTRINLTGRSVPGPSGNIQPSPTSFIQNATVKTIDINSLYLHNTYNTTMKLTSASPTSYDTSGIYHDSNDFAAGATYGGICKAMSGAWNTNHLVMNGQHLWVDTAAGAFRSKSSAPTSDTDGTVI